ncbi:hypothetical protein A7X12_11260 [Sphingomonas sp. TDK1]|nr:hypothetical protein A7X12_11260 [Sphingomonas sp. TDK1]
MRQTIPHAVFAAAARHQGAIAMRGEDGTEIAYQDLEPRVLAAAAGLIDQGIVPGDTVALWAPNCPGWIIAALAIQSAGAVMVPLNTRLKGREAAHILSTAGVRLLLTVPEFLGARFADMIAPFPIETLSQIVMIDPVDGPPPLAADSAVSRLDLLLPDHPSDILFSSGTTGAPKGATTTHGQNVRLFSIYGERLGLGSGDVGLGANPFFHSFGYKAGWLVALLRGATILPHAVFDAAKVLDRIEREKITWLPGPPTIYQSLLAEPLEDRNTTSLRLAITGAAKVPATLIRDMRDMLGFQTVLTAYGLTENCGLVTMCSPDDPVEVVANTAGRPVEGVEIRLVDEAGSPVGPGTRGHLQVRGIGVMRCYIGDPAATARAIDAEGWLRTGDVAVADEAGNIAITDRSDDMFTVGGFNVYPAEVEAILAAHPAIAQAAIVEQPDERLGHVPVAYCRLRPATRIGAEELIAWARAEMANYKVPRRIVFVEQLPLNAAGKVQKFVLRAWASQEGEAA